MVSAKLPPLKSKDMIAFYSASDGLQPLKYGVKELDQSALYSLSDKYDFDIKEWSIGNIITQVSDLEIKPFLHRP